MRSKITGVTAVILAVQAAIVLAQDRSGCLDTKDNYQAIKNCSEFIRAHPNDAPAFHMRGEALARNGDLGQAIIDYSKAIQLNPSYGPAYDSRASAYTNKGDYTRALIDATKAAELAKMGQEAKAKTLVNKEPQKGRPKTTSWVSAKQPNKTQVAPAFNPFEDRSGAP